MTLHFICMKHNTNSLHWQLDANGNTELQNNFSILKNFNKIKWSKLNTKFAIFLITLICSYIYSWLIYILINILSPHLILADDLEYFVRKNDFFQNMKYNYNYSWFKFTLISIFKLYTLNVVTFSLFEKSRD